MHDTLRVLIACQNGREHIPLVVGDAAGKIHVIC